MITKTPGVLTGIVCIIAAALRQGDSCAGPELPLAAAFLAAQRAIALSPASLHA